MTKPIKTVMVTRACIEKILRDGSDEVELEDEIVRFHFVEAVPKAGVRGKGFYVAVDESGKAATAR